ncbi:MAG: ROK family protein [Actinobacteria bacterium]|nr:MAG: ROK family protein [Actinomycetota bacterium]
MARVIGVDVGGTKVAVASLEDGALGEVKMRPTEKASPDALVDQLVEAIEDQGPADAVGLGIPSVIDAARGMAMSSVNIPLQHVPLRDILGRRLDIPVHVDNDASVAALAEAHSEQGELLAQSVVMFTVGTGVGGGLVFGGRIYRGATSSAAELGHTIVFADPSGGAPKPEGFPQPGSLERHAAGGSLDKLAAERGLGDGRGAVEAAQRGDGDAIECLRIIGERLGLAIANALNTFDPELIVIGGGVSTAGEFLLRPARQVAQEFTMRGLGSKTEIRIARYGVNAGVRGAALLALTEEAAAR